MAISIHQWLSGNRDYQLGLKLFKLNGGKEFMYQLLQKSENEYTREKLVEELEKLTRTERFEPPTMEQLRKEIVLPDPEAKEFPKEINEVWDKRQKLYRERDHMHASLEFSDAETRRVYCLKIVSHTREIAKFSRVIQHYQKTGEFLDFDKEVAVDAVSLLDINTRLMNARSNASKHKKKGNKELQAKWDRERKELEKLREKVLNQLNNSIDGIETK